MAKTLKEQIDDLFEEIDREDEELVDANLIATSIEDLQSRVSELETMLTVSLKCNDMLELEQRMNRAAIDLIVETIDGTNGKEE